MSGNHPVEIVPTRLGGFLRAICHHPTCGWVSGVCYTEAKAKTLAQEHATYVSFVRRSPLRPARESGRAR